MGAYAYVYTSGRLTQETINTVTTTDDGTETTTDTLEYAYGAVGPTMVTWNGTTYYYAVNGQGDVMGIFDGSGNCVVTYNWDNAWGYNPEPEGSLASTLGTLNPLRYRSYVYDEETGLYYLNTRYYDPEICRWLNADLAETLTADLENLTQHNLFSYCFNNPANLSDSSGTWPNWSQVAKKIAIGVAAIAVGAIVVAATGGVATAAITGAVVTGLKTAAVAGLVAAGTSATATAVTSVISGDNAKTTIEKTATAAVEGFADGFMWGGISSGASRVAGYITRKTGIFKRSLTYGKNNFMFGTKELTIWRHGANFRIDASLAQGLHYHLRTATTGISQHRTKWIAEIIGGIAGLFNIELE